MSNTWQKKSNLETQFWPEFRFWMCACGPTWKLYHRPLATVPHTVNVKHRLFYCNHLLISEQFRSINAICYNTKQSPQCQLFSVAHLFSRTSFQGKPCGLWFTVSKSCVVSGYTHCWLCILFVFMHISVVDAPIPFSSITLGLATEVSKTDKGGKSFCIDCLLGCIKKWHEIHFTDTIA